MFGFVYIWRDRKHKRYYIGSHWGTIDDGYVCSSRWMRKAYRRRPQDFKRRIVAKVVTNRKELYDEEQRWLNMIKPEEKKIRYYNLNLKLSYSWLDEDNNKKIAEKISIKTQEAMNDPKIRKKYIKGLKKRNTKSSDPEVREKRRQSMIKTMAIKFPEGTRYKDKHPHVKVNSEEHQRKNSEGVKKAWANRSEEELKVIGNKISLGLMGKKNCLGYKQSEEHKEKIRISNQGQKRTDETIKNISLSQQGKFWWTDGINNLKSKECPGLNYKKGRIISWSRKNVSNKEIV